MIEQSNGKSNGQKQDRREKEPAPRPRVTWGTSQADFYQALADKEIEIITQDSKTYRGILRGVDQFDLVLEDPAGDLFLIAKHAIKLARAPKGKAPKE